MVTVSQGSKEVSRRRRYAVVLGSLMAAATAFGPTVLQAQPPPKYTITTVAGNGTHGYDSDGVQATTAPLYIPYSVAIDNSGNLFIADQGNHRIRKVAADGTISTVAGDGVNDYFGDDGAATSASLWSPSGIAVDGSGNLYIGDTGNSVVRKVTGTTITTYAGTGQFGFSEYDADPTDSVDDPPLAIHSAFNKPIGVALDSSGNLYIADLYNHRVRKVTSSGVVSVVAGTGNASYSGDGGPAAEAELNRPVHVAVDSSGNIYIADAQNHRIRKVDGAGNITTVAGNGFPGFSGDGGQATSAMLQYPAGIAVDASGNLYIADMLNNRVRMVNPGGIITTIAGDGKFGFQGDTGPALDARLAFPTDVKVDGAGKVYVVDNQNARIRVLTPMAIPVPSAAPEVNQGGVISASSFGAASEIAPGDWVEIYGKNLAATARAWTAYDFSGANAPTTLDGTSVTIGGQPAYISYVSPQQITAQVPTGVGSGSAEVVVKTGAGTSAARMVTVNAVQPGVFAPVQFRYGGHQYAGALFSDGAFVLPVGAVPGVNGRPAHPGETIVIYGIGFGPSAPAMQAGRIVQQDNTLEQPVQVFFGNTPATLTYAGMVQGSVGLYQLNVTVPEIPASDSVPVSVSVGGVAGAQTLYTAVGN